MLGTTVIIEDGSGTLAMVPYSGTQMRWWRIRPSGAGVAFETTGDGVAWAMIAQSNRAPSAAYDIRLFGGTLGAEPSPGSAQFASANICPP